MAEPQRIHRGAWLEHLKTQKVTGRQLGKVLKEAADDAEASLKGILADTRGMRTAQMSAVQQALRQNSEALWKEVDGITREGLQRATMDAANGEIRLTEWLSESANPIYRDQVRTAARASAENVRANILSQVDLSPRVYRNSEVGIRRARRLVERGIAQNKSTHEIAKSVKGLIRPDTPGGVSYASKRLARTEINRSFHATSAEWNSESPFVNAVQWNLSGSHPRPDKCDEYAEGGSAGPRGLWLPDDVPDKPHPNCLCYTTAVTPEREQFLDELESGEYDAWMRNRGGVRTSRDAVATLPPRQETSGTMATTSHNPRDPSTYQLSEAERARKLKRIKESGTGAIGRTAGRRRIREFGTKEWDGPGEMIMDSKTGTRYHLSDDLGVSKRDAFLARRDFAEKYPTTADGTSITASSMSAHAESEFGRKHIMLNSKWTNSFDEWNARKRRAVESGWSAKGTGSVRGTVTHELGHQAHFALPEEAEKQIARRLSNEMEGSLFKLEWGSEATEDLQEFVYTQHQEIGKGLSTYATESHEEFVAEAFAEYHLSENPRQIAQIVGEVIDEWLGGV